MSSPLDSGYLDSGHLDSGYPATRYGDKDGRISARLRRGDQPSDLTNPSGTAVDYLALGAGTDADFGLYRWNFGPGRTGPDPHFHRTISESFFILTGTVRLYDGERWLDAEPGDFLYVPPGGIHGFRNESGQPASMLLLFTPGAPREDYFETLAELARGRTMSEQEREAFFRRHDTYWL